MRIDDGPPVPARAVIIATGADYRRPPVENLSQFEGAGVYYAATPMEAQLCAGEEVVVIGGGNSAGQAAVFLAQSARRVHMLVRGDGLADTMSRYLIRRIEDNPAIVLHTRTERAMVRGGGHVDRVGWRDATTGGIEVARRASCFRHGRRRAEYAWLQGCVALDDKGFIKTGPDLRRRISQQPGGRCPGRRTS